MERDQVSSQEIDNPYTLAIPLNIQQEIFTGRETIGSQLEQLLLDRRRPPVLLYGQRRMGKTSLLNNLGRLLPNQIAPLFVDLQGPASRASDPAGFLYNLSRGMITSAKDQRSITLSPLSRESLAADPFTTFDEWLDQVEDQIEGRTALLCLDEFEVLDQALADGHFKESEILGLFRNWIQHRPRFKMLIAGSHTLEEFQRWSSYLINVQVIHISYLTETESRKLIERPIQDFTLRYEPDAVQRVLDLTRCHPALVQLLCSEIVNLKNTQDPAIRRHAVKADIDRAIPTALHTGSFFFGDIQRNQITPQALEILRYMARQGEFAITPHPTLQHRFPHTLNSSLEILNRRELIESIDNGYRFQVELIRHWFAQDPNPGGLP